MGNEMGNNNSSGLQEEENTRDQGRYLQEAGHGDGAQLENHIVPVGESKDYREIETGLDSDVPKAEAESHFVNQIFDEKEKGETEVHHPAGSPKVEVKSNDESGDGTSEIQPASSSEDSKDHEKPLQSSLEENLSQLTDVKLEKQTSIKKEDKEMDNSTFDEKSSTNNPDPQELVDSESDQPNKLDEIQANPSVQDCNESPLENEKKGHPIGDNISQDTGTSSVSVSGATQEVEIKRDDLRVKEMASQEEELFCEERLEIKGDKIGDDLGQKSLVTSEFHSGVEIKCNGESEAISADKSINSHLDVSESIDNCVAFTAETISIRKESEHGENKPDPCPAQSCEESVKGSEIDNANVSQAELVIESECEHNDKRATDCTSDSGSNKDCIEVANVSQSELVMIEPEAVNNEKRATDYASSDPGIKKDSIEEANVFQSELVVIEPEVLHNEKRATDYASSDPGINKDSNEANVSQSELVMIEPEAVNNEQRATDYASSDPGIDKDSIEEANVSQSELVMIKPESHNSGTRSTDYTFCNSGIKNCTEEAKVAENGHLIDVHINNQNEDSAEQHNDSTEEALTVPESGVVLAESSLMPCKVEEVLKEKKIIEGIEEKNEASYGIENNTGVRGSGNQCMPPTLPVEQAEAFFSLPLVQPQDNQQNIESESEKIKSSYESISELKQENCGEFLVTEVSSFDSKNLMAEALLSVAELTVEKPGQDVSEYTIKPAVTVSESNPPAITLSGQCAKDHETPAFSSESYQAQESVGRYSTESNPNGSNIQAQMQKSPSFGLDLRIEARSEESDRTPLLYQDKTAIGDFSTQAYISLGNNSIEHTQDGQDNTTLEYQAMPVEEKVVWIERSDSEKSKTPSLGFLKEEEETRMLMITPQNQDNNNTAATRKENNQVLNLGSKEARSTTSPKSKEKRKHRSSLFTNCMCCTTVIN